MNNSDKKLVYILVGLPVIIIVFFIGLYIGGQNPSEVSNPQATNGKFATGEQFNPYWKAWEVLEAKQINAASSTVDSRIWGSIQGLAASYGDPYTVFFPPAQSKAFQETIAGDFGGVGMEVGIKNNQLTVVAPLKDSPAEKAGVRAGDLILFINATSTTGMAVDQAVGFIRGPKGTKVKITFLTKDSNKPVEKTIVRDTINIPTIDTIEKPGGIFVIRLFSFTATSPELFRGALRKFILSGDHKLILDLRGNPGGYLDAAWDMASYFLPAGKVVVTEDFKRTGMAQVFRSKGYNAFSKALSMVVLVDGGSASAAEILAAALKDQGIATVVGVKTFGKGSVQELIPITPETSLKVTVARWLTPNGHNLSHDGIDPDYNVVVSENDIKEKNDTQMAKAIELLTAKP